MPTTGANISTGFGATRLSTLGGTAGLASTRSTIDVPPTGETDHSYQLAGPESLSTATFTVFDESRRLVLIGLFKNNTEAPYFRYVRGAPGTEAEAAQEVKIQSYPDAFTGDALRENEITFAGNPNAGIYRYSSNGKLFDYSELHPAGVTGTVSGVGVEVGARAAADTVMLIYGSLHDPAMTATTADALVESATDNTFIPGLKTEHTFAQLTGAGYEVALLTGAETNTFYRLRVTGVGGGGAYFPFCLAIKY